MKVFIKNLKIKDTAEISLSVTAELLYNGVPSSIDPSEKDNYETFYSDLIQQYKEIPGNDVMFSEDYLHVGLITKILWESNIKFSVDIDFHEPAQFRKGPLCSRFDFLVDTVQENIDQLIENLDKYYTYDRY